jgi:MarR family transcriptional regulator, transcriptional regulator for hemolysin
MTPTLQSQVEQPLGRMFSFLGKGYLHLLRTRLKHLDIDRNYFALVLIGSHEGEVTQQELAMLLDTDKVSIVRVVDYLSEKGYVRRVKKKDDRRKHSLVLTDKAKLALPEIKKSFSEINEIVLNGLQSSETLELAETIVKIKNNITGNLHIL